ncbi:purine-cytosine permease family protein [Lentzea flava]|uniref:Cytosine permease n=1 Tax=Lentzea flava TaxID=103732 RepID=A0ABQ2UER4_9PSEU|nr:cytosine permease [Lentzea flava]MCP2198558.1 cytosine permease [Lentzea flava]GGU26698.1 cytosine permease [Lentzea flava]
MAALLGHDDQALIRVPDQARHPWLSVATQRFGQTTALSQLLLGATLGFGMTFWDAFLALTIGALLLNAVAVAVGIIGQREGLSTAILTRWTGFGHAGSAMLGLIIALSCTGWFGVQTGLAGVTLAGVAGVLPAPVWSLIFGIVVTVIAAYGVRWMAWTAYLAVPAFLLLLLWLVLTNVNDFAATLSSPAPGPSIGMMTAVTLVTGSFIVGAAIAPDMTRFNRNEWDVVKQTVLGITLGEWVISLAGVVLAHGLSTTDIMGLIGSSSGWIGALVVVTAVLKINDWNLYSASLGLVNFFDAVFAVRISRAQVTVMVGFAGSFLAAAGIVHQFSHFLVLLGVVFPPVTGIMIAEYYVVRRWRNEIISTRPYVPRSAPSWVPASVVIWPVSAVIGELVPFGQSSVNSLVVAFALYVSAGRLDLLRMRTRRATNRKVVGEASAA